MQADGIAGGVAVGAGGLVRRRNGRRRRPAPPLVLHLRARRASWPGSLNARGMIKIEPCRTARTPSTRATIRSCRCTGFSRRRGWAPARVCARSRVFAQMHGRVEPVEDDRERPPRHVRRAEKQKRTKEAVPSVAGLVTPPVRHRMPAPQSQDRFAPHDEAVLLRAQQKLSGHERKRKRDSDDDDDEPALNRSTSELEGSIYVSRSSLTSASDAQAEHQGGGACNGRSCGPGRGRRVGCGCRGGSASEGAAACCQGAAAAGTKAAAARRAAEASQRSARSGAVVVFRLRI